MNSSSKTYYTVTPVNPLQSSWQPDAGVNNKIHVESGITSNWKYRQYMQNNAKHIMKYDSMEYVYASGNNPYIIDNKNVSSNQSAPYRFFSLHDPNTPTVGFSDSDLKQDFLQKQQMSARMIAPSFPTAKP
jgi:hypothetical protein